MPDPSFVPRPATTIREGRHGDTEGVPGLSIQELTGRELVSIAARRGQEQAVVEAVRRRWSLALPATPRSVGDDRLAFVWAGLNQWMAHAPAGTGLEAELHTVLDGLASLTAQGDGRVVLRVSGPAARTVLATGLPIDLHPRAFAAGDAAITLAGHVGVTLRQLDDSPSYEISAFRGFGDDLCGWLCDAGARHGVDVLPRAGGQFAA